MARSQPAMAGDGFYNAHSPQQAASSALAEGALRAAAAAVPASVTASVVADYGCSQGRNSLGPVAAILEELDRGRGRPTAWSVVHTDLPGNDWATFFATVFGPDSYLTSHPGAFPSAIGRSFYEPLLQEASVAVGWSGTSVLWLSARPDVGPGNLFSPLATGEDQRRWAERAASDWDRFVRLRQRELAPGGRLVVSTIQASDALAPFLQLIDGAVRRAARAGTITEAEAEAMTVPTYQRTRAEIDAPFADPTLGLVIDEHTSFVAPDPAYGAFRSHGDAERFADDEVSQIRGWSAPSLAAALDPSRGPAGIAAAIDDLFATIRAAVLADPAAGHCDWTMSLLTASRPS